MLKKEANSRFLFILHNGCKHTANILQKPCQEIRFAIRLGDLVAIGLQIENVGFDIGNHFRAVKAGTAFVVEVETAKIHIRTADHAKIVV